MTNRFEYTAPDGRYLRATDREESGVWVVTSEFGCLIELARLEEVIAGLRDMARQAGGQPEPKPVQVRIPPGPRDFMAMIRKAVGDGPTGSVE